MNLFDEEISGATIAGDYRYNLWRIWDAAKPRVLFCMLNPSTADGTQDDPTIRRCIGFAKAWGCGSLEVVNLFAYRATKPEDMFRAASPNSHASDWYIQEAVCRAELCIAAWGASGGYQERDKAVLAMLREPNCLGVTEAGFPRHPLYVKADTIPTPYSSFWRDYEARRMEATEKV